MDINRTVLAAVQGHHIMFDSDDEESVNLDRQFREHFRMSPETFEEFLKKLHTVTERNVLVGHPEILLEKQGMITLWCLANMESFRSIGDRFGISKSTCWSVVYRISFKILEINRMYKIISWPSTCWSVVYRISFKILEINRMYKIISWPSRQRGLCIMEAFQAINGLEGFCND
ncbi:hypothetical protein QE152_g5182 [Popillia japonica]|uniref:Transposase Helix-turn-helix domain-containing protein n=1 Tax=Popillia japonica TaxID=7064 RepID=A0AAW1MXN1_POPJA